MQKNVSCTGAVRVSGRELSATQRMVHKLMCGVGVLLGGTAAGKTGIAFSGCGFSQAQAGMRLERAFGGGVAGAGWRHSKDEKKLMEALWR
jgi:hypothetical protein